ncbi:MAG: SixA phosphatase family protein [Pseudomonadales bacterium]
MKYLWIIRHAKSSWADPQQRDFDRGLNARGRRDGERLRDYLAQLPNSPTWLWCSSARRALDTAAYVGAGFAIAEHQCVTLDDLYHASASAVLDVLQGTPNEVESVAVVAHNPGLTDLVNGLGAEPVIDNLPTFGIAQFCFAGEHFSDLRFGNASLVQLLTPKSLRG